MMKFALKEYTESTIRKQIEWVDNLDRTSLLKKDLIQLSVMCNPMLQNIKKIINRPWSKIKGGFVTFPWSSVQSLWKWK